MSPALAGRFFTTSSLTQSREVTQKNTSLVEKAGPLTLLFAFACSLGAFGMIFKGCVGMAERAWGLKKSSEPHRLQVGDF